MMSKLFEKILGRLSSAGAVRSQDGVWKASCWSGRGGMHLKKRKMKPFYKFS